MAKKFLKFTGVNPKTIEFLCKQYSLTEENGKIYCDDSNPAFPKLQKYVVAEETNAETEPAAAPEKPVKKKAISKKTPKEDDENTTTNPVTEPASEEKEPESVSAPAPTPDEDETSARMDPIADEILKNKPEKTGNITTGKTIEVSDALEKILDSLEEEQILSPTTTVVYHNLSEKDGAMALNLGAIEEDKVYTFSSQYNARLFELYLLKSARFDAEPIENIPAGCSEKTVVLDIGTTGVNDDDEIIEVSILNVHGVEKYHSLFKPTKAISMGATKANLLTDDLLMLEKNIADEIPTILGILRSADVIISFGKDFDMAALARTVKNDNILKETVRNLDSKVLDIKRDAIDFTEDNYVSLKSICDVLEIDERPRYSTSNNAYQALLVANKLRTGEIVEGVEKPVESQSTSVRKQNCWEVEDEALCMAKVGEILAKGGTIHQIAVFPDGKAIIIFYE